MWPARTAGRLAAMVTRWYRASVFYWVDVGLFQDSDNARVA